MAVGGSVSVRAGAGAEAIAESIVAPAEPGGYPGQGRGVDRGRRRVGLRRARQPQRPYPPLATLWAGAARGGVRPRSGAWYPKPRPTFSDALAAVRYRLWTSATFATSPRHGEVAKIPRARLEQLIQVTCYPA